MRHPGPIVTSANTPLLASEPSSFVEKPVSEMLQQEPSSRRGSRGREIDSQEREIKFRNIFYFPP